MDDYGGLLAMVVIAAAVTAAIAWLAIHRWAPARLLGITLATAVAVSCAFIVVALIADNIGMQARAGGMLATLAFAFTGINAGVIALRGVRIHMGMKSS